MTLILTDDGARPSTSFLHARRNMWIRCHSYGIVVQASQNMQDPRCPKKHKKGRRNENVLHSPRLRLVRPILFAEQQHLDSALVLLISLSRQRLTCVCVSAGISGTDFLNWIEGRGDG
jgi:hypothetical protein